MLNEYFRQLVDFEKKYDCNNFNQWLLHNAESFKTIDKKTSLHISQVCKVKECYKNCWRYAWQYKYYEGYIEVCGIPIEHAWLIDSENNVIDPTLAIRGKRLESQMSKQLGKLDKNDKTYLERESRYALEYFGIHIPHDKITRYAIRKKTYGPFIIDYFVEKTER